MTLTEKLDLLLSERNLNKSQLSTQCGLPYTTIVSLYEKGSENVKRSTLLALARFFNVSLDYLADDDVEERGTRIYASAGHFDVSKLTPEGRERYEEYIEFLADKYTK
ncbi:MAG: helix-turn-helix transcriptional regulator [Eubacteriales bacterium]|nr:helix-turn-helix transcriptional regulator [Eubacteriales bacterium]